MNNNKLIRIYENALDFDKAIKDPNDFKKFNKEFLKKNDQALSEDSEPELFHCILKIINDHPDKYLHKSDDYLTWSELNQITTLNCYKYNYFDYDQSYFKDFNPKEGDFSIIFKYLKHITNIGNYCFVNCKNLIKITIPNSITEINDCCFSCCENLSEIIIPNSVTKLDDYCFNWCENLSEITIPNKVTKIGIGCFCDCINLSEITIPNNVIEIGIRCFRMCKNLTEITIPKRFEKNINNIFYEIDLSKIKITYI